MSGPRSNVIALPSRATITPASGTRRKVLDEMQRLTLELVEIIEREKSGERDGDGTWNDETHPIDGTLHLIGFHWKQLV